MGLREAKKERQRQEIVDAAVDLFRERGFEPTRVQDIVERAWISEGTFFNYFPTKQAVLDAAVEGYLDDVVDRLAERDETAPVLDQLEELVGEAATLFEGDPEFATLLSLNFQSALARGSQRERFGVLIEVFEEGQQRGELRGDIPAHRLAEAYMAVMLVTLSNSLLALGPGPGTADRGDDPLDVRLRQAWAILRGGMAVSDGAGIRPSRRRVRQGTRP